MEFKKILLAVTIVALSLTSILYIQESNKINTYYFINENTDMDTTICKIDNDDDCLADEEYSITKNKDNIYMGIDKENNEFRIITNQEYHSPAWLQYRMNSKNVTSTRMLLVIITGLTILLIICIYDYFYRYEVVEKYGTEE